MRNVLKFLLVLFVLAATVHSQDVRTRRGADQEVRDPSRRSRRSIDWNGATDVIIRHAKHEITKQGKRRLDLPDVCENFKKKLGFIRLKGEFRATGGWLEDFSSLGRVGDVSVAKVGSAVRMTAILGLGDLRLGYERYEVEVHGHGPDGRIDGKIGKNAIRFVVTFDLVNGECKTSLAEVKVIEFDDFEVRLNGLGSFDWLGEKVVEWLTRKRKDDVIAGIERRIAEQITKALKDFECDEYASLLQLPL